MLLVQIQVDIPSKVFNLEDKAHSNISHKYKNKKPIGFIPSKEALNLQI